MNETKAGKGVWITAGVSIFGVVLSLGYDRFLKESPLPKAQFNHSEDMTENIEVLFDGTNSADPRGSSLTYQWFIDDQAITTDETFKHVFKSPGNFRVKLVVTNKAKKSHQHSKIIKVHSYEAKIGESRVNLPRTKATTKNLRSEKPAPKVLRLRHGQSVHIEHWGTVSCVFESVEGEIYGVVLTESTEGKRIIFGPDLFAFKRSDSVLNLHVSEVDNKLGAISFTAELIDK